MVRGKFRAGSRSKPEGGPAGLEITRVGSWRLTHHARWRGQLPDLALVGLISALPLVALRPLQNAPFIDDWAYAWSVEHLRRTGELRILGWAVSQNVAQVLWGALFCAPFGFSFRHADATRNGCCSVDRPFRLIVGPPGHLVLSCQIELTLRNDPGHSP
jgi:hypothetical protein